MEKNATQFYIDKHKKLNNKFFLSYECGNDGTLFYKGKNHL